MIDITALAERVAAGEIVTTPSGEAAAELLAELQRRGRVKQGSRWQGNTFTIEVTEVRG